MTTHALHARRSGSSATFVIVVSIVLFLGACVMALVLALSNAPTALAIGVVLAALPVAPLIGCFMWLDRYEPEPRSLLLLALGWGAFVATSSALFLQIAGRYVFEAPESFGGAVVAPLTEEAMKGLFISLLLWFRRANIDGVLDGIVYAGMIGVGFAFTENILYLSSAYIGGTGSPGGLASAIGVFVVRGIFSPFAHPLFTAFTGIGIGLAVNTTRIPVRVFAPIGGYLLAVAAHAIWNGSAFLGGGDTFVMTYVFVMVPAFLVVAALAVWARGREVTVLTAALNDCVRRGFVTPAEVPWLTNLAARRIARRNARVVGGDAAYRAMTNYQRDAVMLGFLHSRYLRGVAPDDFVERGQALVDSMGRLRGSLIWPHSTGTK